MTGAAATAPTRADLRAEFLRGAKEILPIMVGIIPFGLVAGASAIDAGLTTLDAVGFSMGIFAGASQLAAIKLLGEGAALPVVVLTVAVINLRMLMYSASLAPLWSSLPLRRRAPAAYVLTDQAYAFSVARAPTADTQAHLWAYYLGCAITLWVNWQFWTVVGAMAGAAIPPEIPLEFAIPMVFLVLLVPAVTDRPTLAAAITAGAGATLLSGLPYNLGLFVGALSGVAVGTVVALRSPATPAVAANAREDDR